MSKYQNNVFYDYQCWYLVFSSNYRHRLVLKIPFPDHIFQNLEITYWKSSFPVHRQILRPLSPPFKLCSPNWSGVRRNLWSLKWRREGVKRKTSNNWRKVSQIALKGGEGGWELCLEEFGPFNSCGIIDSWNLEWYICTLGLKF